MATVGSSPTTSTNNNLINNYQKMKLEILPKKQEIKKPNYPYLGISKSLTLVLFTAPKSGLCLRDGHHGYYTNKFITNWEENNFATFEGSIILSND